MTARTLVIVLVCSALLPTAAFPIEAAQEMELVTVTGSSIGTSRNDALLALRVVDREEIESTGAKTIGDLLKYLPEIDFSTTSMQSSGNLSAGTSFIRLRGLTANNTLVLLDGHRLPLNPLQSSSGSDNAVDINMIPLAAIERIEILSNTASAIYGADAVAGVVNLITRKTEDGVRVAGNYGSSKYGDGQDKRFSLTAGRGDLKQDRFQGILVFEHAERNPIFRVDRDLSKTADFRRFGGSDLRSTNAPEGNIISGLNAGQSLRPCAAENLNGTVCRYDTNAMPISALLGMETWNLLTQGTWQIDDTTRWNTQLNFARKTLGYELAPSPDNWTLPSGQVIQGRFMQGGNRFNSQSNTLYRLHSVLEGEFHAQRWTIAAGYGASENGSRYGNRFQKTALQDAISTGIIDPTLTTNNQSIVDALKVAPEVHTRTSIAYTNATLSGSLWRSEGFGLRYATGLQWQRESLLEQPDPMIANGEIAGFIARSAIDAGRSARGAFGELQFDLSDQIKLQAALRYDDFGTTNHLSKKLAIAYTPDKRLTLRGSWGESFLMPSLSQMYSAGSSSVITLSGNNCTLIGQASDCTQSGFLVNRANAALKPETATSRSFGLDAKPFQFLRTTLDAWQIEKSNEIIRQSSTEALQNGQYQLQNGLIYLDSQNINRSSTKLSGFDFGLGFNFYLGTWGDLAITNSLTRYLRYERQNTPGSGSINYLGYASTMPKWRNQLAVTWYKDSWVTSLFVRTTAGFIDAASSDLVDASTRTLPSYTEADLIVTYKANARLDLSAGIQNFTNAQPPFSQTAAASLQGMPNMPYYDLRGAYYFVSANYRFDPP